MKAENPYFSNQKFFTHPWLVFYPLFWHWSCGHFSIFVNFPLSSHEKRGGKKLVQWGIKLFFLEKYSNSTFFSSKNEVNRTKTRESSTIFVKGNLRDFYVSFTHRMSYVNVFNLAWEYFFQLSIFLTKWV